MIHRRPVSLAAAAKSRAPMRVANRSGSAEPWGDPVVARELAALGHEVKQVPPAYSKPFRQGHKNDFRDAHAVAKALAGC
jgi:hypothetical protein